MTQIIPAGGGWYLQEDHEDPAYDAVVAWQTAEDAEGRQILLPYIDQGRGYPPSLLDEPTLASLNMKLVYKPTL